MGSGSSVEKTQEENEGEVLVTNEDNSTAFISLHMTSISIVSSISLLAMAVIIICLIFICVKLKLCSGVCCAQCYEEPGNIVVITMLPQSRFPILQGTVGARADRESKMWTEEESSDFSKKPAIPPTNSRTSSWDSNNSLLLEKLARNQ